MSIGGRSLHKDDYLKLALLGGGAMTGLGAAGIGPMAGLFANGGAMAGTALGGAAELASVGEAAGLGAPAAAASGGLLGGTGKGLLKGLESLQRANALVAMAQGPQGQQMAQPRPQPAMPMYGDAMRLWQQIYGGLT